MTTHVDRKLEELGLALPQAAAPVASYVPVVEAGGLLHVSGQLPFRDGAVITGRLGDGTSLEEGQEAARACGLSYKGAWDAVQALNNLFERPLVEAQTGGRQGGAAAVTAALAAETL